MQTHAGWAVGGLQGDGKARGGALVLLEQAADSRGVTSALWRLILAASNRLRDRSRRPASLASAAAMRWLNLSCMACSLRRRSAERHRIAVSPVSGQRASLTAMPSRISRQPLGSASSTANWRKLALGAPMM
jgi:hypothetical protein